MNTRGKTRLFCFTHVICTSFFVSCALHFESYRNVTDLFTAAEQETVITLERTVCLGSCPSYRLAVYGDGTVIFEGRAYVKETRRIISKIDENRINKLIEAFGEADYFGLPTQDRLYENCDIMATDHSTVISSIRIDGRFKRIEFYHGRYKMGEDGEPTYPDELERLFRLENLIDTIVNTSQWIE